MVFKIYPHQYYKFKYLFLITNETLYIHSHFQVKQIHAYIIFGISICIFYLKVSLRQLQKLNYRNI